MAEQQFCDQYNLDYWHQSCYLCLCVCYGYGGRLEVKEADWELEGCRFEPPGCLRGDLQGVSWQPWVL